MTAITEAVVTAHADATATRTEADAIGKGWHAYRRVTRAEWPAASSDAATEAFQKLHLTLETYADLLSDMAHPAAVYPELEHDDEAYDKALSMTAQDAADWAAELDRLVPDVAAPAAGGERRVSNDSDSYTYPPTGEEFPCVTTILGAHRRQARTSSPGPPGSPPSTPSTTSSRSAAVRTAGP